MAHENTDTTDDSFAGELEIRVVGPRGFNVFHVKRVDLNSGYVTTIAMPVLLPDGRTVQLAADLKVTEVIKGREGGS